MEKIHGNAHVFVLTCKFLTFKHKNMHVSMYFLHLELTFTPHYILTDKGSIGPKYKSGSIYISAYMWSSGFQHRKWYTACKLVDVLLCKLHTCTSSLCPVAPGAKTISLENFIVSSVDHMTLLTVT